jgi:CheY-like chemotaxis protein
LLANYGESQSDACVAAISESVAKTVKSSELFSIPIPKDMALEQLANRIEQAAAQAPCVEPEEPPRLKSDHSESAPSSPPVDAATALPPTSPPWTATGGASPTKVLIIDDEPMICQMVQWFLRQRRIEVVSAESLTQAQQHLAEAAVVLCDVHIADASGIDLTRKLRKDGFAGPIIIISGDRSRDTVGGSILAGATDFLAKPFDESALVDKLRKHTRLVQETKAAPIPV